MCELLAEEAPAVALRGSSMGGFVAIHAGAGWGEAAAVVAICPAPEDLLLRGLRSERLVEFEVDREAIEPWLEALDLYEAVGRLGPRTALLLMHAEGDEQIPYTVSQELHKAAKEPKRLLRAARRPPPLAPARRRDAGRVPALYRAARLVPELDAAVADLHVGKVADDVGERLAGLADGVAELGADLADRVAEAAGDLLGAVGHLIRPLAAVNGRARWERRAAVR